MSTSTPALGSWELSRQASAYHAVGSWEVTRQASAYPALGSWEVTRQASAYQQLEASAPNANAPIQCGWEPPRKVGAWQSLETNHPGAGARPIVSTLPSTTEFQSESSENCVTNTYKEETKTNFETLISVPSPRSPNEKSATGSQAPDVGAVPLPYFGSPAPSFEAKASTASSTPIRSSPKRPEGRPLHGQGQLWNSRASFSERSQSLLGSPIQSFRGLRAGTSFQSSPWPRVTSGRRSAFATPLSAGGSSLQKGRPQHSASDAAARPESGQSSRRSSDAQQTSKREATIAALLAARGASPVMSHTPGEPCEIADGMPLEKDWRKGSPTLVMSREVEAAFSSASKRFSERTHGPMSRQLSQQ